MLNNDVLRSLRYTLEINNAKMAEICGLSGLKIAKNEIHSYLVDEKDPEYKICGDRVAAHFLDGLIIFRRGRQEGKPPQPVEPHISNNVVLKKLRVAFELKEEDVIAIVKSAGFELTPSELSAFMRKRDHRNFRECGDQVLRYLLKGLTLKLQGPGRS